jgi:hypothetical protein
VFLRPTEDGFVGRPVQPGFVDVPHLPWGLCFRTNSHTTAGMF